MALVDYSYSDSETEEDPQHINASPTALSSPLSSNSKELKRKRDEPKQTSELPPLPAAFHDLYSTNARVSTRDDPSLHGGRKRAVPHVEGNWPTHVYLEWHPSLTESKALQTLIDLVKESTTRWKDSHTSQLHKIGDGPEVNPLLLSPLGAPLPLHISLSRSLTLQSPQKEPFLDRFTTAVRKSAVRPFNITFTEPKWVPNFEHTRWFLVLGIAKPGKDELNGLLEASNETAAVFGLPGLYSSGNFDAGSEAGASRSNGKGKRKAIAMRDCTNAFHISIAWMLTEPPPQFKSALKSFNDVAESPLVTNSMRSPDHPFDVVKVKVGNVIHNVPLAPSRGFEKGGILGGI